MGRWDILMPKLSLLLLMFMPSTSSTESDTKILVIRGEGRERGKPSVWLYISFVTVRSVPQA